MVEQDLEVREKRELEAGREQTIPGKYFVPATDIYETEDKLMVVMEMPGVEKKNVNIQLEKNELTVEGHIDSEKYAQIHPVYTEYNIGHFSRSFRLSSEIDQERIEAKVADGVLALYLPKLQEATPRRIKIS